VTLSDILVNYGPRNQFALVTRFVLTFVVIFTYPLSFHSLRLSVLTLLGSTSLSKETVNSTWFYVTVCGILVALTVVPGALVTNVGVVLDYKVWTCQLCHSHSLFFFAHAMCVHWALAGGNFWQQHHLHLPWSDVHPGRDILFCRVVL